MVPAKASAFNQIWINHVKAIVFYEYGGPEVLHLKEVEKPTPKDKEVLIKTHAALASTGDCEIRTLDFPTWLWLPIRIMFGFRKPKRPIPGFYLSGEIEAVGKNVIRYKKGDQVFGSSDLRMGAYAEYICLPEDGTIAIKPSNMTYVEAAAVSLGLDALHFLGKAKVRPGQKVLVNGAGGGIGTIAVQYAKHLGAEVTAVDSTPKLDMLRTIGADHVIDYTRQDFTNGRETYDVIFNLIHHSSMSRAMALLAKDGRYILANPKLNQFIRGFWHTKTSGRKVISVFADPISDDLDFMRELIESGSIKAVIDRCYPLEQAAEAHAYVDKGQKKGNVVLNIIDSDPVD